MFWGFTPAVDLIEEYVKIGNKVPEELNFLVIGSADCRHILKTIARKYRHSNVRLNFYILEGCVESIARQLLLLKTALQHSDALGFVQKTRFFMELYGNTLIRPSAAKFLTEMSLELIKVVTNHDYLKSTMPFLTLDIKYKERDYLESLLKFWASLDDFNLIEIWDRRVRQSLGMRYDSKLGAFDWDLHMRMHAVRGNQICNQEYRNFRLTGVAFSWLEFEASKPNRSMVYGVIPNGDKFAHCGYLGDVQTGPFVAFGLDCEDEKFLKSTNGQNAYRATDVTERNLNQIFYEIQHGEKYVHTGISDLQLGPVVMQNGGTKVVDCKASTIGNKKSVKKTLRIENVNITISTTSMLDSTKFTQYKGSFNIIYFSHFYVKYFEKDLIESIAAPNSLILLENKKFHLSLREKQLKEFAVAIDKLVQTIKLEMLEFDVLIDDLVRFIAK